MEIVHILQNTLTDLPVLDSIPFFTDCGWNLEREYFGAVVNGEIVGLLCFSPKSFFDPRALGVSYIAVDQQHRQLGIATTLISAFFDYAQLCKKPVIVSRYEPDGLLYLKSVIQATAKHYAVALTERN